MTVSSTTRKAGPYSGNGVTTTFPFAFKVFTDEDIQPVLTPPTGNPVNLVLNSDYSVLLNADQDANPGGTVTYPIGVGPVPMPSDSTLTIIGNLAYDQQTDITNAGRFLPQVIENAMDKVTILVQQLKEISGRTLQAAVGTTVQLLFPAPSSGKFIRWRSDLTGLENADAGTDSMVLQGLLLDSTNPALGAGMVGFGSSLTYPASTVGSKLQEIVLKLKDTVSVKDLQFGAKGDGVTNDTAAIQAAIDYLIAKGGGALYIPSGTYNVNAPLVVTNGSRLRIYGDGPDISIIRTTSTTANVFVSTTQDFYRTFENFGITSSVTRTAGYYFDLADERRGMFYRMHLSRHFHGMILRKFEQTSLSELYIVNPSGPGNGVQAGTSAATNQGADLKILNCFISGNDDTNPASAPVGLIGLVGYDVEAIFGVNTDILNFVTSSMFIGPQFAAQNWAFSQCFFDATKNGDNIVFSGAGVKARFCFTGCWIASAGKLTGGAPDVHGVHFGNSGTYLDIQFVGGRIHSNNGDGVLFENADIDVNFTGVQFYNNGVVSATYKYGIQFASGVAQTQYAVINGCKFRGQGTADVRAEINARWNVLTGCMLEQGVSSGATLGWGGCAGNSDISSFDLASASTLLPSPTKDAVTVNGTTTINSIRATYPNHKLTLSFSGALTVVDGANLRLNGNLVTAAGTVLSLACQADGSWREESRTTT